MTVTAPSRSPSSSIVGRRVGYTIAIVVNSLLLYLINVRPGWEQLTFLTADASEVIWLVNLSLIVGIFANAVYVWSDTWWLKGIGELTTTSIGLVVAIRVWQVFPFEFQDSPVPWAALARWVLAIAVVGSLIAIVTQLALLVKRSIDH